MKWSSNSFFACALVLFFLCHRASAAIEAIEFDDGSLLMRFKVEDLTDMINYFSFFLMKKATAFGGLKNEIVGHVSLSVVQSFVVFNLMSPFFTGFSSIDEFWDDFESHTVQLVGIGLLFLMCLLYDFCFVCHGVYRLIMFHVKMKDIDSLFGTCDDPEYIRNKLIEEKVKIDYKLKGGADGGLSYLPLFSKRIPSNQSVNVEKARFVILIRPFSKERKKYPKPFYDVDYDGSRSGLVDVIRSTIGEFYSYSIHDVDDFVLVRAGDDLRKQKVSRVMIDVWNVRPSKTTPASG